MRVPAKSYLLAILAITFWSTAGSAFKLSLRYLEFSELLCIASLTASAALFLMLWSSGRLPDLAVLSKREVLHSAFLGFLNPFLYYTVLLYAYSIIPAQEAVALNYTWPLVLVLMAALILKQRTTLRDVLCLLLGFLGILVISTRGDLTGLHFANPAGDGLALGSAFIWAVFWILNLKDTRDEVRKLFLSFLFGFIYSLVFMLVRQGLCMPPFRGVVGGIYVGLFEMGITFVLWLKALRLSGSTAKVANLVFISPFLSLIFIHFMIGETIYASSVLGLAMIVSGILLQRKQTQIREN